MPASEYAYRPSYKARADKLEVQLQAERRKREAAEREVERLKRLLTDPRVRFVMAIAGSES